MKARWIASVLLLVAVTTACVSDPQVAARPIKLGVIYNLTGSQASLDISSANGAMLAAKEINAAGGVLARPLELVQYNGESDLPTIRNAAEQLAETDEVVAMLGFSDSDMVLAAAPIAAKAGMVFVTSGATSPKLPEQVPDYLYLACFGDNVQAAAGTEYAYSTLQAKTAYLLIDQGMEYTRLLGRYFKERFAELGGQIVLEDTYQGGSKDFSAQITRLKELTRMTDILFISAGPDDVGTIVKQFRDAGVDKPILGGDGYDTPLLVEIAGESANSTYFTTHALLDPGLGTDKVKEFIAAYQAEFEVAPENAFAGLGYDTVKLIADAITRAGSADPEAIREALQTTKDLAGVTGVITFQPGKRIPQKSVTTVLVEDGRFIPAAELAPERVPTP